MTTPSFDLTGLRHLHYRHFSCIGTAAGVTVLAEFNDAVAALLYGKAEAKKWIASGRDNDIISVEILNFDGDIVLGEMVEAFCTLRPEVDRAVA